MNDLLQPGQHLDPDQLNAFLEGVLPEHEQMQSLAHLAGCDQCREIVFLAKQAQQAEEPVPVKATPAWRDWFSFGPLSMLGAASAALACALIVTVTLHLHHSEPPTATTETARVEPAPSLPSTDRREEAPAAKAPALAEAVNKPVFPPPAPSASAPLASKEKSRTAETSISAGASLDASVASPPPHPLSAPAVITPKADSASDGTSADSDNLRLPRELRRVQPTPPVVAGAPLPSAADSLARAKAKTVIAGTMPPAAATANATATASITQAQPENASLHPLPSKLPIVTTVSNGKLMLAADSVGKLFFSKNGGRHWKTVKQQWQGKVTQLALAPQTEAKDTADNRPVAPSGFELTTEAGIVWISSDGLHWQQK
jgi:hypothetical protein